MSRVSPQPYPPHFSWLSEHSADALSTEVFAQHLSQGLHQTLLCQPQNSLPTAVPQAATSGPQGFGEAASKLWFLHPMGLCWCDPISSGHPSNARAVQSYSMQGRKQCARTRDLQKCQVSKFMAIKVMSKDKGC